MKKLCVALALLAASPAAAYDRETVFKMFIATSVYSKVCGHWLSAEADHRLEVLMRQYHIDFKNKDVAREAVRRMGAQMMALRTPHQVAEFCAMLKPDIEDFERAAVGQ